VRKAVIGALVLALGAGAYYATLPHFPPLTGITRLEVRGPRGPLREVTQPDTVARVAALAERHVPRWRSVLAPAEGGPLAVTFYRGREPVRVVQFGGGSVMSCAADVCVARPVGREVLRELVGLLRVPTRLVDVPALDPAI
jgi:hypothetical protein